jgi:hypothetical protein
MYNLIQDNPTKFLQLTILMLVVGCFVLPGQASAQAEGDGLFFYNMNGNSNLYTKNYVNSSNTFSATSTLDLPLGPQVRTVIKSSPIKKEMIVGFGGDSGLLQIMCYDGTTWTDEFISIITGASTTRSFDIAYETSTGDAMVIYGDGNSDTSNLLYRTKSGNLGCGEENWSSEQTYDTLRTTGDIRWVKLAEDRRATSTLLAVVWADLNRDLSAAIWSGTAWGNEHTAALETTLEVATAAQDVESFDLAYESLSGDLMVTWGSGGTDGTNGAFYAVCTGGTSSCTWGSVRTAMPTFLDDATHISMAADPLSDRILFASVGNAGSDLQRGIWSGTAWTNNANVDTTAAAPTAGRRFVATGWLSNGSANRAVITYYDSGATNIGWYTASGTTWTTQTDVTPTTAFGTQTQYKIVMNPFQTNELMFIVHNSARQVFAKRLSMTSGGVFTWSNPDGGVLAGGVASNIYPAGDFAYWRSLSAGPTEVFLSGTLYTDRGVTAVGAGENISLAISTTSLGIYSTTTASGGAWEFTVYPYDFSSTSPLLLFVNGEDFKANTLISNYTASISGIPIYGNNIVIHGATTTSLVNPADFGFYTSANDVDILYATSTGTFSATTSVMVTQGNLEVSEIVEVKGDLINDAGGIRDDEGTLRLTGENHIISGSLTGANKLPTLEIVGNYDFSNNASATGMYIRAGGDLTAPAYMTVEGKFHNEGTFRNNDGKVYLGENGKEPLKFVTGFGKDGSPESEFDWGGSFNAQIVVGDYIYVGGSGFGFECSQTVGDAPGCDILVFDVSDPGSPVMVYSMASDGLASGTGGDANVQAFALSGNTLYVGKDANTTACSQTAGSAKGCEIMVLDVTNPAVPVYRAGRDSSGNNTGTTGVRIRTMTVSGNYLYVGKGGDSTACSQSAGSAHGCELMIFDISSTTNPTYVAGRDLDASTNGTNGDGDFFGGIWDLVVRGNFLYVALSPNGGSCALSAGGAGGCSLQIYNITTPTSPVLVGTLAGTGNPTTDFGFGGFRAINFKDNILYLGKVYGGGTCLSVTGNGADACELQIYDVSSSTNPVFIAGRDATGVLGGKSEYGNDIVGIEIYGSNLYLVKYTNGRDLCNPIAGLAASCELQVYDISSTTNPVFVHGKSFSGGYFQFGTPFSYDRTILINNGYLYTTLTGGTGGACHYVTNPLGCAFQVYQLGSGAVVGGNFTSASDLHDVEVVGSGIVTGQASTSALTLRGSFFTTHTNNITVSGNLNKITGDTVFGHDNTVYLVSNNPQTIAGNFTEISSWPNLSLAGTGAKTFTGLATTTQVFVQSDATVTFDELVEVRDNLNNTGDLTLSEGIILNGIYNNAGTVDIQGDADIVGGAISHFVGGYDISGQVSGNSYGDFNNFQNFEIDGDYLYAVGGADGECLSNLSNVEGCALWVYDISDPYNITVVAGRDKSGNNGEGYSPGHNALAIKDNYLYIGSDQGYANCSDSSYDCEIQVYDITDPADPSFVVGRSAAGSAASTGGRPVFAVAIAGNYLYVGKEGDGAACSQTPGSATGCELMVFDISTPSSPTYVAGRDASGSAAGTVELSITSLVVSGNYLYVGKRGDSTTCSQSAGSARGCELMVFDVSTPSDPIYVAGLDGDTTKTGTTDKGVVDIRVLGDMLYTGHGQYYSDCNNSDRTGCHIIIWDISSSTNPVYLSGISGQGTEGAGSGLAGSKVLPYSDRVYLTKGYSTSMGCDTSYPELGIEGCELMVFDVSSSTNPVYLSARDTSGAEVGSSANSFSPMAIKDEYLYVGNGTGFGGFSLIPCVSEVGKAAGCELQVYRLKPLLEGNMTGSSAFSNLEISGTGATIVDNITTANLTLLDGVVDAPATTTVSGNFTNQAEFVAGTGEVVLNGVNQTITGTTTFHNLTKNANVAAVTTFEAGSLTTVLGRWNFSGVSGVIPHQLRSSVTDSYWYIDPATSTLSALDVRDSYNLNVTTINCDFECINSTNNINWSFTPYEPPTGGVTMSSGGNQHFYVGQATTTLRDINITTTGGNVVTATNDIRIAIATSTTNLRFDVSTTPTFGGNAASKVSGVTYELGGAVMVVDVTSDFVDGDTLSISGAKVGSFAAVASTYSQFGLYTNGSITGEAAATDDGRIYLTGSVSIGNHDAGQTANQFSTMTVSDRTILAFNINPTSETYSVTDFVVSLSGIQKLATSNFSNIRLYRDNNNDRSLDGGDTLLDGSGIMTINGQLGAINFSADFSITTVANYIVVADISGTTLGSSIYLTLDSSSINGSGSVSSYSPYFISTLTSAYHIRNSGIGSTGVSRVSTPGTIITGGTSGAGGGAGQETDGENIAADPDFYRPASTGSPNDEWTNGSNALVSDGSYATAGSASLRQSFAGFQFNIPTGNTVQGIAVKIDASGTTAAGTIEVALSWDGGSSYTTMKATPTVSGSDIVYLLGGPADSWGRAWTPGEFSTENFRLRVTAQPSANTLRLDGLEMRVYHQSGGGGGGGGGRS